MATDAQIAAGYRTDNGLLRAQIARLERENADKQERINTAVRRMDHIAYQLRGSAGSVLISDIREDLLLCQSNLRGK